MASSPSFNITIGGYDLTSRELFFRDETGVYGPGNLGGYGTPNGARGDYALFLVAQRRETQQRVTLDQAVANPLTAAEWRFLPRQDGWVQLNAYAVPLADTTLPPPLADPLPKPVVIAPGPAPVLALLFPAPAPAPFAADYVPTDLFAYDEANGGLARRYCYLDPRGVTISEWLRVEPTELLDSAYLVKTINELVAIDTPTLRAKLNEACILLDYDLVPDQFCEPQGERVRRAFRLVKAHLEAAAYQWRRGNYYVAQQNLESIALLAADQLVAA